MVSETAKKPEMADKGKARGQWPRYLDRLVNSGQWAELSFGAKAMLPIYYVLANRETGESYWGMEKLTRVSGLTDRGIRKATAELKAAGLVARSWDEDRRHSAVTTVLPFDAPAIDWEAEKLAKTGIPGAEPIAPRVRNPKTPPLRNPGSVGTEPDAPQVRHPGSDHPQCITTSIINKASADVAADVEDELREEVVEALQIAGVTSSGAKSVMLDVPGLTPAVVRNLAKRAAKGVNPPGLLLMLLREEGPEMIASFNKSRSQKSIPAPVLDVAAITRADLEERKKMAAKFTQSHPPPPSSSPSNSIQHV